MPNQWSDDLFSQILTYYQVAADADELTGIVEQIQTGEAREMLKGHRNRKMLYEVSVRGKDVGIWATMPTEETEPFLHSAVFGRDLRALQHDLLDQNK